MKRTTSRRMGTTSSGFTIVELLIVVVVIAILAAITIVAYNGIQERARASAVQSTVRQAATTLQSNALQNGENFAATLTAAGVNTSGPATYQYRSNNALNPRLFCVSASQYNLSYFISDVQASPAVGTCDQQNHLRAASSAWESGDYSQTTANPTANTTRVRQPGSIPVVPGANYLINTGSSSYNFTIRGLNQSQTFATSFGGVSDGTILTIPNDVYFIVVGLFGPGGATYSSMVNALDTGVVTPSIVRAP